MSSLIYSLFDNAIHSLKRSIKHACEARTDKGEWKFAILLLVQAIELSFKELLFRNHHVLIYEDIDKQNNYTVSLKLAVTRLQKIAKIYFNKTDLDILKSAIDWRNQIMHYKWSSNVEEANKIFYVLISFLREFFEKYFDVSLMELIGEELWIEVLNVEEFVKDSMRRIENKIKEKGIDEEFIWECKNCGQHTFVIQDDENTCCHCGYYERVFMCDRCKELKYFSEMTEVYIGNGRGLDAWDILCSDCFKRLDDF